MSISEIIFTILIPISYCHTIFRQFQLFNIKHIHEIARISICITFIIAQSEIFDVRTYLLPRWKFIISLHYVLIITFIRSSVLIGKYNTLNSIQIYLIIGFFGQCIWITIFILYSNSINKIMQSVNIFFLII